jgi:hypothetical protein
VGFTFLDWLQLFLPCVKWLRTYRVREFLLVSAAGMFCRNWMSSVQEELPATCMRHQMSI